MQPVRGGEGAGLQVRKRKGEGNSINRSIDHLKLIKRAHEATFAVFSQVVKRASDRCTDGAFLPPAPLHTMSLLRPSPSLSLRLRLLLLQQDRQAHARTGERTLMRTYAHVYG